MNGQIEKYTTRELLILISEVLEELHSRKVIRTKNNPLGDYAEWLVAKAMNLRLMANSSSGHDAVSENGTRFQIKARRITPANPSRQLSAIRNLEHVDFDFLIAVIFNSDYEVIECVRIPHAVVCEHSVYRTHTNAHILHLRPPVIADGRVTSVLEQVRAAQ